MATTTNFSVRMDSDIKKQCETLYGELGINLQLEQLAPWSETAKANCQN